MNKYPFTTDGHGNAIPEHVVIAEKVIGKRLPKGAQIHHVDGDGFNNAHTNLVVCPSQAYHKLLHIRARALESCGNAGWLRCIRCKQWDAPTNLSMYIPKDQTSPRAHHKECQSKYENARRRKAML